TGAGWCRAPRRVGARGRAPVGRWRRVVVGLYSRFIHYNGISVVLQGGPVNGGLEWRPRHNPWLIALAVMLGTFMEVLATSVANVALPHIAGSLSATPEEATWVLTSYLVSNAIILPTTAWLSSVFGRKRFLLACIAIFTMSSAMCGAATSLGMLILA